MANFDEIAKRTRAVHDETEAARQAREQEESKKRDVDFAATVKALELFAGPLFEEARRAFESSGVPCIVQNNWSTMGRPMSPEVSFQCVGRETRNSIGGSFVSKGVKVFASYDGELFRVGHGDDGHSNHIGKNAKQSAQPDVQVLTDYLEVALKTYYENDASHRRL